jgi:hypothetical protein
MAVFRDESYDAIFASPRPDGGYDGQLRIHLKRLGKQRRLILLAFAPKAAGTFFRSAMIDLVGGQLIRAAHAQGGRDAVPYLPTFLAYYEGGVTNHVMVSHVHMQALPANVNFIEAFGIRPIIMMRSIPDMLASYLDMLESDPEARKDGLNCRIPANFVEMSREAKADFAIDILGPWYASYFATWMRYSGDNPERVCVLDFDGFVASPAQTLARAAVHAGIPRTMDECQAAYDNNWKEREKHRHNKGRSGRGNEYFTPDQLGRLRRMLQYYPVLNACRDALMGAGTPAMLDKIAS